MTSCPGCCASLHEGQDFLLHCMCCVYARVPAVRAAMDRLSEPETAEHRRGRALSETRQRESARRLAAKAKP